MNKIIECVPNFSEGRDTAVLEALAECAGSVAGVALLDHSADFSHNRSVYTLAGSPEGVAEAAFRLCALACERIDLTRHTGEHPRMGAADVVPFVPIRGANMAECAELAEKLAARIWAELGVPCYLYEHAARTPSRQNLADVRRGGFEGLAEKMKLPEWAPDYGGREPHPTAGAFAVGARQPLVAFNINLKTSDITVARDIARAVRGSSGGLKYCKAIGVMLEDRAQVSMNLVNCEETPIFQVFEAVRAEAEKRGVKIAGSELIGLAPAKSLADCAAHWLMLENYDYDKQILEHRLP